MINIYTDGSHKEQYGSWAYVIVKNNKVIGEAFGREIKTTSYRMEFQAAIEALKSLQKKSKVTIFTDSKILVDAMNIHLKDWKANGWLKAKNKPIPHLDLVLILDELINKHKITWTWVRAHSGVQYNERCDELCIQARTI